MGKEKIFIQRRKGGFNTDESEEDLRKKVIRNIIRSSRTKRDKFFFVRNPGL